MGVLNTVSSQIRGVTNALNQSNVDSALRRSGASSALPAPPRYSFEIWDDIGPADNDALQGSPQAVVFRLAPNNISFSQPVRADVSMDLLGNPVVVDGGLGLARCTVRGTYGVGGRMDPTQESPGFANMREIRDFFMGWAVLNRQRATDGLLLLRLMFSVRNGAWSEWRLWQWWVIPTELPTEERTAGRPHEWSYSMSFWCLDRTTPPPVDTLPGPLTTQVASERLSALQAALRSYRQATDAAKDLSNQMATLKSDVDTLRAAAIAEVRDVTDTIRRASLAATGIIKATNPAMFRDEVTENYRGTLISVRKNLGQMKVWGTTMATTSAGSARVAPTVPPGGSIQQMAALSGTLSSWPDLAAKNGLRYPFVKV